ncbi:MAG: arsenite S-adenosylmethyltransferase [Deltaproteobacteria bacterium HGW-Deltaproteobacteria-19]|jgi:SAM-dependent methyltransferase|nr:MAG: arsenite S-adenosylmethyltransferase [Deltaproteobacteria bacterium HGW-Deltaproteobacteria-19]
MKNEDIRTNVREGYGKIAVTGNSCCSLPIAGCCGGAQQAAAIGKAVGYSDEDLASVPEGANLGLGCGNPVALASLREGETVVDLGSGAGFDAFLASRQVGPTGRVIGVDMTPEMLDKARENARKGGYENVAFRLGEIEHLPVAEGEADAIISNCVINLSPDKQQVFREAFRVLKSGGRLMVSDIVLTKDLPEAIKASLTAWIGCVAGAARKDDYLGAIAAAGFTDIEVVGQNVFPVDFLLNDPTVQTMVRDLGLSREALSDLAATAVSIRVSAVRPAR